MAVTRGKIKPITCKWTSSAGGAATVDIPDFSGFLLLSVRSAPGANGDLTTDLPDSYTLTLINDLTGEDILAGEGSARSATVADAAEIATTKVPIPGAMTLTIAAAGSGKQGIVYIELLETG